jgi:hypothetical protein
MGVFVQRVAFAALNQCVHLDPATVCTAVTGFTYRVSDAIVSCDNQQVQLVGMCASNTGTADVTVNDAIVTSTTQANNLHCWCMMFSPVVSKWVYRYAYSSAAECRNSCAVGCSNAFTYNYSGDQSFRNAMISNLTK